METTLKSNQKNNPQQEDFVRILFYVCAGLFVISSLGVLFSQLFRPLSRTMFLWFVAVGLSLLSTVILFLTGMYKGFSGKSFSLVGYSIIFLVVLGLIGFGTCLLNLSGM